MSFATMTLAESPCWMLLSFACRTGTDYQTEPKHIFFRLWQTASLLNSLVLSSVHMELLFLLDM